jgi:hypothetical protein
VAVREASEVETEESKETPDKMDANERAKSRPQSARHFSTESTPAIRDQCHKTFYGRYLRRFVMRYSVNPL